jgi:hypothetical protein
LAESFTAPFPSARNTLARWKNSHQDVDFITRGTLHTFDWRPAGIGDFNGDSPSDIVWTEPA